MLIIIFLPFTLDGSRIDLESRIDTDRILMEGENASNVDISLFRELRYFFGPIRFACNFLSSDSQDGEKEQVCNQQHCCPPVRATHYQQPANQNTLSLDIL